METDDLWLQMCRELSGFSDVSARFAGSARAYFDQVNGLQKAEDLVAVFKTGGARALCAADAGADLKPVKDLLWYLYTGAGRTADQTVPEDYFEALLWRAALAHPPALSGGYFGHWRYPPEDAFDG